MTEQTPGAPRRRGTLIALIALPVVAAVLAAGAAFAVTANRDDDRHLDSGSTPASAGSDSTNSSSTRSSGSPSASVGSGSGGAGSTGSGSAVTEFVAARDAAERAVPGTATHVARTARGWQVEIRRTGTGADVDVALESDFTVTGTDADSGSDRGDVAGSASLSGDALRTALTAALAAAGSGAPSSIDLGTSTHAYYDVVVTQGQSVVEIDLAQDYRVLRTETEIED